MLRISCDLYLSSHPSILLSLGVAISAQYAVSKLYNDPLLRTSISLVASQDGKLAASTTKIESSSSDTTATSTEPTTTHHLEAPSLSVAISSAILLAFVIGFVQLIIYYIMAESIIQGMGVTNTNTMWPHAISYLKIRALGTPAATLWLVVNGIFRG